MTLEKQNDSIGLLVTTFSRPKWFYDALSCNTLYLYLVKKNLGNSASRTAALMYFTVEKKKTNSLQNYIIFACTEEKFLTQCVR